MTAERFERELYAVPNLLPFLSQQELAEPPPPMEWLVEGLLVKGTYGQIAGEMKTYKSYLALALALGVASGTPVLGYFTVPQPQPVVMFVGEGGVGPLKNRLHAMAKTMGLDLANLPLHVTTAVASLDSPRFKDTLAWALEKFRPGLVVLDPYYAFHGGAVQAANLHDEGALLTGLSSPIVAAGASLMIVNHFNQTGSGDGLKRITQSGSGEWVDTWMLVKAEKKYNPATGEFLQVVEVGSRQWGGRSFRVRWSLGTINPLTGQHVGDVTFQVYVNQSGLDSEVIAADPSYRARKILEILERAPDGLTKTKLIEAAGGRKAETEKSIEALLAKGTLVRRKGLQLERNRSVTRDLLIKSPGIDDDIGR